MAAVTVPASTVKHLPLTLSSSESNQKTANISTLELQDNEKTSLVLRTFRCLIADLCEQFKGGHPGSAMGMAAIGVALWKFVLSNVGYKNMTIDQLKSYHSKRTDSLCPGHPEIEHEGIEVTTGPLGQGIANAVGLAMATKHLAATYNKPGFELVNNKTWCMIGDACLQEGVGLEAISLAGHFRLNNLIVVYDNNQITCDGSVDLTNTEDVNAKMVACGWKVIDVLDGNHDVEGIVSALVEARASTDKPVFINIRTLIGIGSKVAGDAKAHGAAFGAEDVANIKKNAGFDAQQFFHIPQEVYDYFATVRGEGCQFEAEWNQVVSAYGKEYPELAAEFACRVRGEFPQDWTKIIPKKEDFPTTPTPSRKSAGLVCNPLAAKLNNFMVGTADLSPSVNMAWNGKVDFQHLTDDVKPDLRPSCGILGEYTGRYIHWGVREHAMASISNGLAAFNKGTILPVTSSFFMFYIYAAPGVRMGALQRLQSIHIATHDSIGTGEDGPTHQPIELAALYRAMPNLQYIRPCDSEETAGAFIAALSARDTPTIISLSRQNLQQYPEHSSREGVLKGAYVLIEEQDADVTLIGVGAEMVFAVEARNVLKQQGVKARVVSFPCHRLFEKQDLEYKAQVLQYRAGIPRVAVEAYAAMGWERYADAAYSMSTDRFGHSLPGAEAYEYFGFNAAKIAAEVQSFVGEWKQRGPEAFRGEFRDLNKTCSKASPAQELSMNPSNLEQVGPSDLDAAAERRFLWKLDLIVLPLLAIIHFTHSLDRANLGNAKTANLEADLGLQGNQYSLVLVLFYIPYGTLNVPLTVAARRLSPARVIPVLMVFWGAISAASAAATGFGGLLATRICLGVVEAGFFPSAVYYLTLFYTPAEIAKRISLFYATGLHPAAALRRDVAVLPRPRPRRGPGAGAASAQLEPEVFSWRSTLAPLAGWETWFFAGIALSYGVACASVSNFLPTMIKRLAAGDAVRANLYTIAPNLSGAVFIVAVCALSDRLRRRAPFVILSTAVAMLGFILLGTLELARLPGVGYFCTFLITFGTFTSAVLVPAWASGNIASRSARATTLGLISGMQNLGGIISSVVFRAEDAPVYRPALITSGVFQGCVVVLAAAGWIWYRRENQKLDKGGQQEQRRML
ncbi:hypothetical protein G7054_g12399 [Neopestalotiopsis clavispora]|nr:hypothetical protein G7054_g12399 [Neopestalotiopsis clavispora]